MVSSLQNSSTRKVTLARRSPHFERLAKTYLFDGNIDRSKLIDLSIGDTSEPLSQTIVDAVIKEAKAMGTHTGYKGYGPCQGEQRLREKIAAYYKGISPDEIFISDGAKCDVGRLHLLFQPGVVAIQNPTYPVYRDTSLLTGCKEIVEIPCTPENNFFPETLPEADLIYLCSPNNPTGTVLTHAQLQRCVEHAHRTGAHIIFDAAYSAFIQDPTLPRSIFEIDGACEVAIEVNS